MCLFTNTGQLHTLKVMDLPMGKFRDKGVPVDNISNFDSSKETILYAASQSDFPAILDRLLHCIAGVVNCFQAVFCPQLHAADADSPFFLLR